MHHTFFRTNFIRKIHKSHPEGNCTKGQLHNYIFRHVRTQLAYAVPVKIQEGPQFEEKYLTFGKIKFFRRHIKNFVQTLFPKKLFYTCRSWIKLKIYKLHTENISENQQCQQ